MHKFSATLAVATSAAVTLVFGINAASAQSVARQWNEQLLEAIRLDTPRPTVHARNLFHASGTMYDAWAAYDVTAAGYLYDADAPAVDVESARDEAISFAAYRLLSARFAGSPGAAVTLPALEAQMKSLGYDHANTSTVGNTPAAVGNRIAAAYLGHGLADGSNELGDYADTTGYVPINAPMIVVNPGTTMADPGRWQPLTIETVGGPSHADVPHAALGPGQTVCRPAAEPRRDVRQ